MRISRQPFPVQIMMNQKQFENVEYINSLVSMITNDARHAHEIKIRIAIAKVGFSKNKKKRRRRRRRRRRKTLFACELDINLRNKQVKCYICMVPEIGNFVKQIRNTWKVFEYGAGEEEISISPIVWGRKYYKESRKKGVSYKQ